MRGDANWTETNEIEHHAWRGFEKEFWTWKATLPDDSEVFDMHFHEQINAYWACHK